MPSQSSKVGLDVCSGQGLAAAYRKRSSLEVLGYVITSGTGKLHGPGISGKLCVGISDLTVNGSKYWVRFDGTFKGIAKVTGQLAPAKLLSCDPARVQRGAFAERSNRGERRPRPETPAQPLHWTLTRTCCRTCRTNQPQKWKRCSLGKGRLPLLKHLLFGTRCCAASSRSSAEFLLERSINPACSDIGQTKLCTLKNDESFCDAELSEHAGPV